MTAPLDTLDDALAAFTAIGCDPKKNGSGWALRCPHPDHDDDTPSANLKAGTDRPWIIHCHACAPPGGSEARAEWFRAILERVEAGTPLPPANPSSRGRSGSGNGAGYGIPVAEYDYVDADGVLRAQKVRYVDPESGKKSFRFRRPFGDHWVYDLGMGGSMAALPMYGLPSLAFEGPVFVVEGEKDADRLHALGVAAVSSAGGANKVPESVTLPDDVSGLAGREVWIVPDRDDAGAGYAAAWAARLAGVAASVTTVVVPLDTPGADTSDWLDTTGIADAGAWIAACAAAQVELEPEPGPETTAATLAEAHAVFQKWLGAEYDLDALNVVLAAVAVERLDGDPLWVLVVSGSGNAKTETVQAVGDGAVMVSTISSLGALLSATAKKERAKDASGGLLRLLEPRGVLVIKDVTSILSMSRDARNEVLGALREVHDGSWTRTVGTDGGRSLTWIGRIAVIGAVTTAWDTHHSVIATMGDRFAIVRIDSGAAATRAVGGRQAMSNIGSESAMREELRAVVAGVIAGMEPGGIQATEAEENRILAAADLVTLARTAVEYGYNGDVVDAHAPEMPTRFAKELVQVMRGAVAVGMARADAMELAIRVARDSMPPLRLAILDDLAAHPRSTTYEVRRRIGKPRSTVDRQLQALHMLGVVAVEEAANLGGFGGAVKWMYRLADGISPDCLRYRTRPSNGGRGAEGDPAAADALTRPTWVEPYLGREGQVAGVEEPVPDPGETRPSNGGRGAGGEPPAADAKSRPTWVEPHLGREGQGVGVEESGSEAGEATEPLTCSVCGERMAYDILGDGVHPTCTPAGGSR